MKKFIALVAIAAFVLTVTPALAYGRHSSSDITVENDNHAFVSNDVSVGAYTGGNQAVAGDATGGNANGGNVNGDIGTGDAAAIGYVSNVVNSNDTRIKAPCTRNCTGDIEIENESKAKVENSLGVEADTGLNFAVAGDATATNSGCHHRCNTSTANGGSVNGDIKTGDANSYGDVVNVVNINLTRVRR